MASVGRCLNDPERIVEGHGFNRAVKSAKPDVLCLWGNS
jgi:hypothetical protein